MSPEFEVQHLPEGAARLKPFKAAQSPVKVAWWLSPLRAYIHANVGTQDNRVIFRDFEHAAA